MLWRLDSGITKNLHTNPPRQNRPLTNRDIFIVQDYVRVTSDNDGGTNDETWFYTYNHDVDHPYFAPRSGFVRGKMNYQGMVAVLGDGGKTRLTWLVNMDFGGAVPTSFMNAMIVNLMIFPVSVVERTIEHLQEKKGNVTAVTSRVDLEDLTSSGAKQGKRDGVAVELELRDLKAKLARIKVENEDLRRMDGKRQSELAGKDEELRRKDGELEKKDKQIMELRKRLSRVVNED